MGLYFDQTAAASPVAVLQPQQHLSQPYDMNSDRRNHANHSQYLPDVTTPSMWPLQGQPQRLSPASGRKRSRDEAADSLEDNNYYPMLAAPIEESEEGWEYGEGMTLVKPNGFIIDASSQTGTWVEEKAEISQLKPPAPEKTSYMPDRPILRNHKSQRLDLAATPIINEEVSQSNGTTVLSSSSKTTVAGSEDPIVDAFTIHLGIGWSRISADEHIQAAARGWARYIENHYPLTSVQIRLQSKGLSSYLVEANEGWFLFGEDLKEGRLVSTSLDETFENLRRSPPVFDGIEILAAAAETPGPLVDSKQEITITRASEANNPISGLATDVVPFPQTPIQEVIMNGINEIQSPPGHELEIEMDMS